MVLHVLGTIDDNTFECDFVVNLEFFSRLYAEEEYVEALRNIAIWYVPVRFTEYLRIPNEYHPESTISRHSSLNQANFDEFRGIEETNEGLPVRRRVGFLTSASIIAASCVPTFIYLALRAREAEVEDVIQTTLAILASTLFILASPVHRTLFNNWSISEALAGRMTLDEDSVLNLSTHKERHDLGVDLISLGRMSLQSSRASYAAPYSARGLDAGPMDLKTLAGPAAHLLIVDQDGVLVLKYDDDHAIELLVDDREENEVIGARAYKGFRFWQVVRVPESARQCLLQ